MKPGLLVVGLLLALIGAGLIWLGLDGILGLLHDARTPSNRDLVVAGAALLLGGGVLLGRASRSKAGLRAAPGDVDEK